MLVATMELNYKFFGPRLKELRELKGLTQDALAEEVGMSQDSISALEGGRRNPSWRVALELCRALSVDPTAFLQPPTPHPKKTGPGRPRKGKEEDVQ